MSYKLKTLIVFDTNSLRSTNAGEVAYSFFVFGRPFQVVEEFIKENRLSDDVHLAIPTWAVEELKDQKKRQYEEDVVEFQKLAKRLSGMPNIKEITLLDNDFDCKRYIQEKANEFLSSKEVKLLEIKTEFASKILQSMMERVMKEKNKKRPFVESGKYKDAGFKDNLIWESLIHFEGIADFDKVVFLTKDTDYGNCQYEFKDKGNKHISILSDENNVIVELKKDYGNYIDERAIYDFAQTEYFRDYLLDILKIKSEIIIDGISFKIENFNIIDTCAIVGRKPPTEDEDERIFIYSDIKIDFAEKGTKYEQHILTKTMLADDETKDIMETTFEPELI